MTGERAVIIAVVAVAATGLALWLAGELADSRDRRRAAPRHARREEEPLRHEPGRAA